MPKFLAFFCFVSLVSAQSSPRIIDFNNNAWFSYSGDHAVSGRWGLHFDGQWRRSELGTGWQQGQLRPGLNYQLSPKVLLTLGYAFTRTYPYGDFPARVAFPEHRVYQQVLVNHNFRGLRLQHRTRLEQRYIRSANGADNWTYRNRFRYLARAEAPLARTDSAEWYVAAYDEILIGIPPNIGPRPFDQNRIFIGVGRSARGFKVEGGYMVQFSGQGNGRIWEFNNTLMFSVSSSKPLKQLFGID